MAADALIQELMIVPPLQGVLEALDEALPDALYQPSFARDLRNFRVARGKWETRLGQSLWQSIPGSGDVRMFAAHYEAAGKRVRLAARSSGAAAILYDFVEGTDTVFNTTTGGTGLGGTTEPYFPGVTLNDTFYFLDRSGPLRKYQETPPSGNQVRTVALPVRPSAAPVAKSKTYDFLEVWAGADPFGWTETDDTGFDLDDGTIANAGSVPDGLESPIGGVTAVFDTKTSPKNKPISDNVTGELVPSADIAMWVYNGNLPSQIVFQFGIVTVTDYTVSMDMPTKETFLPLFIRIGAIGTINFKRFMVVKNTGAADIYISRIALPGRLQGSYRWVYTHYDPVLKRESEPSDISNSGTPLDLSTIGVTGQSATAAAFQKSSALTPTSDSGSDATTTEIRWYRNGGVASLTRDGRGIDIWLRVGTIADFATTNNTAPSAGATSFGVASVGTATADISIGDWLVLDKGNIPVAGANGEEFVRVTNIVGTTITVSRGLEYSHALGRTVQVAFVDNVANESIDVTARIHLERDDPPTGAKRIARSPDGRIWLANFPGKPTGIRVSNRATPDRPNDYEVFPDEVDPFTRRDPLQGWPFEIGGDATDEEITALFFFNDRPFAFTRRNLYAINALSQLDWGPYAVVKIHATGCIAPDTVQECNGVLYWVADGPRVMRWAGQGEPEDISHQKVSDRLSEVPSWLTAFARYHATLQGGYWRLWYEPGSTEIGGINPLTLSSGPIIYLNSTLGLSGAHGSAVTTWPDQSGGGRDATQSDASRKPALQTTSNLSPLGRQMVLFGGVSPSDDSLSFGSDLPDRTEATIIVYGRADITGIGALTECYLPYSSPTGNRPALFVRTDNECGAFTNDGALVGARTQETGTDKEWSEFVLENAKHRMWAWRFAAPEGASGVVSVFRGNAASLVKGSDKTGWGWTELSADGYIISKTAGNAGYRGTLGLVLRYHAALADSQIEDLYQYIKTRFGFDP